MVILATVEQSPWCFKNKEILHIHRIVRILKSLKTPHYFLSFATNSVLGTKTVILRPSIETRRMLQHRLFWANAQQSNKIREETNKMKNLDWQHSLCWKMCPREKRHWAQGIKWAHFTSVLILTQQKKERKNWQGEVNSAASYLPSFYFLF